MRKNELLLSLVAAVLAFSTPAFAEEKHDHDHKAPHGGELLEVGDHVAHVEMIHDEKAGKITLYILGANVKTPLSLKEAPKINLKTAAGNKSIETKLVDSKDGTSSQFEAIDEALKAEPLVGRIALTLNDKKYNIDIKDEHKHEAPKK